MKIFLKTLTFLGILAAGFALFAFLRSSRAAPEQEGDKNPAPMVETVTAASADEHAVVHASGTVVPARSVTITPQVGGKIVWQSSDLVPGGRVKKGQVLARIEPTDYDLVLAQQKSRVAQAELALTQEQGLKAVAEKQWDLMGEEVELTEEGKKLALRDAQLENALAALEAAKSALEKARLDRQRTVIKAPFDAVVTEKLVDVGQVIGPTSRLATLVDADRLWVRASVPVDRLSWIDIPGMNAEEGSSVEIVQKVGQSVRVRRRGRVIELLGELDPKGRMARILIEVTKPFDAVDAPSDNETSPPETKEERGLPLLIGAYVFVDILGPRLEDLIALPRHALRDDDTVWVLENGALSVRKILPVWSRKDTMFVRGELDPGEEVIMSRIITPVPGMALRPVPKEKAAVGMNEAEDASSPPEETR